jgi:hypothetical protein
MEHPLDISITAPFDIGDVMAQVVLEQSAPIKVVLRGGRFNAPQLSRPLRMSLILDPAPANVEPLRTSSPATPGVPAGKTVGIDQLFGSGLEIPPDGRLQVQVLWGCHCHSESLPHQPEGKRFGSWEHLRCADFIGKATTGANPEKLQIGGVEAPFDKTTTLPVGGNELTFGEIVCLAGDYYAHLDADARQVLESAWPPMDGITGWLEGEDYRSTTLEIDEEKNVRNLLDIVKRDKDGDSGWLGEFAHAKDAGKGKYPARRYLALSAQNYCHFVSPGLAGQAPADDFALWLYLRYHDRALALALKSTNATNPRRALFAALAVDAFGCHFLTDHFAGGHLRVPRRLLGETYGILRGSLWMSLRMHSEDNQVGLWCRSRIASETGRRIVWQAYGDGMLLRDEARDNLRQVQEAVRRSAAEVFAASRNTSVDPADRADALVPIPLKPGSRPGPNDQLPEEQTPPVNPRPNPWPLYWFDKAGNVLVRGSDPWMMSYEFQHWGPAASPEPMPF